MDCLLVSGKWTSPTPRGSVPGVLYQTLDVSLQRLFSDQSLGPLPCPLPLSVTHLWPAVPLPASLGMKSQMELPPGCNEHAGDVV